MSINNNLNTNINFLIDGEWDVRKIQEHPGKFFRQWKANRYMHPPYLVRKVTEIFPVIYTNVIANGNLSSQIKGLKLLSHFPEKIPAYPEDFRHFITQIEHNLPKISSPKMLNSIRKVFISLSSVSQNIFPSKFFTMSLQLQNQQLFHINRFIWATQSRFFRDNFGCFSANSTSTLWKFSFPDSCLTHLDKWMMEKNPTLQKFWLLLLDLKVQINLLEAAIIFSIPALEEVLLKIIWNRKLETPTLFAKF